MTRFSDTLVGTNLNSIWLEGTLVAAPRAIPALGIPAYRFRIRAPRHPDAPSVFVVEADGPAFVECRTPLTGGRSVRIIGRLRQHRWVDPRGGVHETIKIIGELVEPVGALT